MIVGFTGTQHGMTRGQFARAKEILRLLTPTQIDVRDELHHGGCVGADAQMHRYALDLGLKVHVYWGDVAANKQMPEVDPRDRRVCLHGLEPPLVRNRNIVDACAVLLAAPRQRKEVLRSGTWATIRYASSVSRTTILIYP